MKETIKQVLCMPSLWIIIIYMVLPVDLIEDSIPVAGVLDDAVITFVCILCSKLAGNKSAK